MLVDKQINASIMLWEWEKLDDFGGVEIVAEQGENYPYFQGQQFHLIWFSRGDGKPIPTKAN